MCRSASGCPASLTCAQVLASSGQPWGPPHPSSSLWSEHGRPSSPSGFDLRGSMPGSQEAQRQRDGLSPPPRRTFQTCASLTGVGGQAELLASVSLSRPSPPSLFLPLLEELSQSLDSICFSFRSASKRARSVSRRRMCLSTWAVGRKEEEDKEGELVSVASGQCSSCPNSS